MLLMRWSLPAYKSVVITNFEDKFSVLQSQFMKTSHMRQYSTTVQCPETTSASQMSHNKEKKIRCR